VKLKKKKSLKKVPRFAWISKNVQELLMVIAGIFDMWNSVAL